MKNSMKISVIIPCYNAEKWIERCLNSVINQTIGINVIQIICIDDASNDNTYSILKSFDKTYSNIFLIHLDQNRGVSYARNIALSFCSGEYIFFIDSDDSIAPNALELLLSKAYETNSELTMSAYMCTNFNDDACPTRLGDDWYRDLTNKEERKWYITHIPTVSVWAKLWKRDFITKNNLRFDEDIHIGEDFLFDAQTRFLLNSISFVNVTLYFYYNNSDSVTRNTTYSSTNIHEVTSNAQKLIQHLKNRNLYDWVISNFNQELQWHIIGTCYFYPMSKIYTEINFVKNNILEIFPNISQCEYLQVLDSFHSKLFSFIKQ